MSSIWSNAASAAGASPFTATGTAPSPGGGRAMRFQSALQSTGKAQSATQSKSASGAQAAIQPGLSPSRAAASKVAKPTGAASSATGSDDGSTISSNDFLTLLVTEMQNQDPTANTDPNEYINQLVQINSLEQLISINQNLATVLGAAASQVTGGGSAVDTQATPAHATSPRAAMPTVSGTSASGSKTASAVAGGNLSLPRPSPASHSVAHALDGHVRAGRAGHSMRDIPTRSLQR